MQRAAKMLSHSTLVPVAYRAQKEIKEYGKVVALEDNPNGLPNCVVALNMAQRMGADPLMVMQNLYIVEGRPSWSSQFIIAAINSCGKYSPLRFALSEPEAPKEVVYTATEWQDQPNGGKAKKVSVEKSVRVRHQECYAWAIEKETGERLQSPTISIQMAIDEGWLTKNGSKWQTMPEVMLRYRAAAFFGKIYAPELLMGLQTAEETTDIIDLEERPDGTHAVDIDKLRETGEQADTPPRARRRAPADATDVDSQSVAQAGKQKSEATEEISRGAAQAQAGGIPAQDPASAGPAITGESTYQDIAKALEAAKTVAELDVIVSFIAAFNAEDQDSLYGIANDRKYDIETAAKQQARPQRDRGTRPSVE
ncbi:hypothetical protein ACQUFY_08235 [Robbsia andropogonis]|uniref:hypothetical protein n=1 Tax=Robbsia andropogonis TaxID=28092 RepID=UPI003D263F3E